MFFFNLNLNLNPLSSCPRHPFNGFRKVSLARACHDTHKPAFSTQKPKYSDSDQENNSPQKTAKR